MAEPMHIKIGQYTQQRRPHVDPAAFAETGQPLEAEKILRFHRP